MLKLLNSKFYILNSRRGFTLIEILIVVAIIGILASVILVGLGPTQSRARDSRRISDLRQIQQGLELSFNRNGVYPVQAAAVAVTALATDFTAVGITTIPDDPRPAQHYQYITDANGNTYVLSAALENDQGAGIQDSGLPAGITGIDCGNVRVYCVSL